MAGDWIKWTKGLGRKEEVLSIARKLNQNRRVIACACMELWEWADTETFDGHIRGTDTAFVDELVGLPGFASALEGEKWVRFTTTGISFLNWERHNGETAKRRMQDAARKKERRSASPDDVRKMSVSKADISAATSSLLLSSGSLPSGSEGGRGETAPPAPTGQIRPHFDDDPPVLSHWLPAAKRLMGLYPRRMGGRAAVSAFAVALQAVADRGDTDPEAYLSQSVRAFAEAVKGKAPDFIPSPVTWARDGRYDDNHAAAYGGEPTQAEMSADLEAALNAGRKKR